MTKKIVPVYTKLVTIVKFCTDCGDCWPYRPQSRKCALCGGELKVGNTLQGA
jgi:hypothetical protein